MVHTVDRSRLWAAQTPQIFRRDTLATAFRQAGAAADDYTDEGALLESQGIEVRLFRGDPANIKVTVPADVEVAAALLTSRDRAGEHGTLTTDDGPLATRVGTGYDIHIAWCRGVGLFSVAWPWSTRKARGWPGTPTPTW